MNIRQAARAAVFMLAGTAAQAQIVISGNDGHQLTPGQVQVPDTVSVIDFNKSPPRLLGSIAAPASLIGAPAGVAISRGGKFALVASDTKIDPANPLKTVPNDALTVLDIESPANPKITQSLHTEAGANGVAMNRAETLALVANTQGHSISIFSIAHGRLTAAGRLALGDVSPSDIAFRPDGKSAVVASATGLILLSVDGTNVTVARSLAPTLSASNVVLTGGGKYAIVNVTPAAPATPYKVSLIDLASGAVISSANFNGDVVEGIALSPDGRYLVGVTVNGSHNAPGAPGYHDFSLVQVFGVNGTAITSITDAHAGHWCQGAAWSRNDHTIMVQCAIEGDLEAFHFDGKALTPDAAATIKLGARPGTIGAQPLR